MTFEFDGTSDQPTRITCAAIPGVSAVTPHEFAYDPLGQLVGATAPDGTIERRYDSFGRIVEETSHGKSLRFAYDDATRVSELVFPDGRRERTESDARGRPTRVTLVTPGALGGTAGEVLTEIQYAMARRPTRITHGNGVLTSLTYDDAGRMVGLEHTRAGALLDSYRARYDERGRHAVVQLLGTPRSNTLHHFDTADRLREARWGFTLPPLPDVTTPAEHKAAIVAATTGAVTATSAESYDLDQADDRKQRVRVDAGTMNTDTYVFAPDHRILAASGQPITYHADGHRATDVQHRYDVDALGRIVRVRDAASGAVQAEFAYDALSRPATGMLDGKTFTRWFAGERWVQEIHGALGDVRQASPHPLFPQPLCVLDGSETLFVHPDGGMATLCVTDDTGAVRERHRYGPFGAPSLFASDGVTPIPPAAAAVEPMWRGMPLLASTGLYTTPQRLYDPEVGVFISRDPLLYIDSPSPYAFAAHNPVDFADPTGLAKSPLADKGYSIAPPPPVSGTNYRFYMPHGFIWQQYEGALQDAWNPDNPDWARVVLGLLAIVAAPAAGAEEYVGRTVLNLPYVIDNLGTGIGEHIARGYLWTQQDEPAEAAADWLEALYNFSLGFLQAAQVAEPGLRPGNKAAVMNELANVRDAFKALHLDNRGGMKIPGTHLPELVVDYSSHPDLAENIWHAQRAGHKTVLTYAGDKALANANRYAATRRVPRLLSRDEYPFASTFEGGRATWIGHIPAWQNSSQGGLLSAFYRRYGLVAGDQFSVTVINHPGLP